MKKIILSIGFAVLSSLALQAQKYAVIDTRYILDKMPDYKTAQNLELNSDLLFINRAIVYGQLGDFNNAISDLNNAIILNPQSSQSYYLRGVAKFQIGNGGCDDLLIAKQNNFPNADKALDNYCGSVK